MPLGGRRAPVTTGEIPRVVVLDRDEIVPTISRILTKTPHWPGQALVYDGTIGHTILLRGADAGARTITFSNPEPGDSLLTDAQPAKQEGLRRAEQERLWKIDFRTWRECSSAHSSPLLGTYRR